MDPLSIAMAILITALTVNDVVNKKPSIDRDDAHVRYGCFDYRTSKIYTFVEKRSDPSRGAFGARTPQGETIDMQDMKVDLDPHDPNWIRFRTDDGTSYMVNTWPDANTGFHPAISQRKDGIRSDVHMFCMDGDEFMTDRGATQSRFKRLIEELKGNKQHEPYESGVPF